MPLSGGARNEKKFEALLKDHWPTLHRLGLVTDDPPQHFKGAEQDNGKPIYFEIFDWRDGAVDGLTSTRK